LLIGMASRRFLQACHSLCGVEAVAGMGSGLMLDAFLGPLGLGEVGVRPAGLHEIRL
jgi:hypothetical protein